MGWRKELINAGQDKDRAIDKLNIRLTQLRDENDELKRNLQQDRITAAAEMEVAVGQFNSVSKEKEEAEKKLVTAAAEMEVAVREFNSVSKEKEEAEKKLVQIEKVVCELEAESSSQRNQIHRLEQKVQMQRRTIWGVVSSLFVVAAASLAYAVSRR